MTAATFRSLRQSLKLMVTIAPVLGTPSMAAEPQSFFPQSLLHATVPCGPAFQNRPMPIISDLENNWFSGQLRAASEPSLAPDARRQIPYRGVIRFTWLRSFHPPVIVRIDGLESISARIIAKQLSGAGGYDPGSISKHIERPLTAKQTDEFRKLITQTDILNLPAKNCDLGVDGAEWLIEGVDQKGYHLISRWSPDQGETRRVGLAMLALTGWRFKDIY
jgi:hypothetical protein